MNVVTFQIITNMIQNRSFSLGMHENKNILKDFDNYQELINKIPVKQ